MPAGVLSYLPWWCAFAAGRWSTGVLSGRAAPEYLASSPDPDRCSLSALGPQRRLQTPKSRFTPESRWLASREWDNHWAFFVVWGSPDETVVRDNISRKLRRMVPCRNTEVRSGAPTRQLGAHAKRIGASAKCAPRRLGLDWVG